MRTILLLLLPTGCTIDNRITDLPETADPFAAVCQPTTTSAYEPPSTHRKFAGQAVAVTEAGSSSTTQILERFLVVGSPGHVNWLNDVPAPTPGYVEIKPALTTTGLLDGTAATQQITRPFTTAEQFGWSLARGDLRVCRTSGAVNLGCGEEFLVGAPAVTTSANGAVYWYEPTSDPNLYYTYGGAIPMPSYLTTSGSIGAEFGYAVAATQAFVNSSSPWNVAPKYTSWVAIGAPGADRVFIYDINENTGTYTENQMIVAPTSGLRFGSSLAVGNVDGDEYPDLIVGAPGDGGDAGMVYIYRGQQITSGTPTPLRLIPLMLSSETAPPTAFGVSFPSLVDNEYGYSVAAGQFMGIGIDAIIIGAPGQTLDEDFGPTHAEAGAVCQLMLKAATNAPGLAVDVAQTCLPNIDTPTARALDGDRWGHAVAVANFYGMDEAGNFYSAAGYQHEVAVSRPGYDDTFTDQGNVLILGTGPGGIDYDPMTYFDPPLTQFLGSSSEAWFGATLATGYVQYMLFADLAIGAPNADSGNGDVSLTQAVQSPATTPPATSPLHGLWTAEDDLEETRHLVVRDTTDGTTVVHEILFAERFVLHLKDEDDNFCTIRDNQEFGPAAGHKIVLPQRSFATGTETWEDLDAWETVGSLFEDEAEDLLDGALVDVTITISSSTPPELELDINLEDLPWGAIVFALEADDLARPDTETDFSEDCRPRNPITAVQLSDAVCEG